MLAAFFDLDGCLVDSRAAIAEAMNHALSELQLEPQPAADLHRFIGPPLLGGFEQLLTDLGEDPARASQAVVAYRAVYGELAVRMTTPAPGIAELLRTLAGSLRLLVVTSKPTEYAEPILMTLELHQHFEFVLGPSLDALTEPKAAKLEQALHIVGLPPGESRRLGLMVGDRKYDIAAGKACGTVTAGVTWGIGDQVELCEAGADFIIDHPEELADLLRKDG